MTTLEVLCEHYKQSNSYKERSLIANDRASPSRKESPAAYLSANTLNYALKHGTDLDRQAVLQMVDLYISKKVQLPDQRLKSL